MPFRNSNSLKICFTCVHFWSLNFFRLNYFKIDGVRSIFAARPIVSRECAHYIAVITKQYFPFGVLGQVNWFSLITPTIKHYVHNYLDHFQSYKIWMFCLFFVFSTKAHKKCHDGLHNLKICQFFYRCWLSSSAAIPYQIIRSLQPDDVGMCVAKVIW